MYRVPIDSERQLHSESLSEHDRYYYLSPFVRELVTKAQHTPKSRRLYHVSSTDRGGGVAEMLPKIIAMSHELGFFTDWLIMQPQADRTASVSLPASGMWSDTSASSSLFSANSISISSSSSPEQHRTDNNSSSANRSLIPSLPIPTSLSNSVQSLSDKLNWISNGVRFIV